MILIPPPNVTGKLHIGHALQFTLQDLMIRWRRMQGFNALWLPGTDHAGIATQVMVERELAKEGSSRRDLGREKFLERMWAWKAQYKDNISHQAKALGASCDWTRERFTLDPMLSRAVRHAFVQLHGEGLIYRAHRLINWCPRCLTALSDLEVVHKDIDGGMWDFAYPLADGGEIVVSTSRPETMLGDTAVAVHPEDERYRHLVGKLVRHPFVDRTFPVIADATLVDPAFGTGAVKVTPAHDPNDFATGERHGLAKINILTEDGKINDHGGPFAGQDRFAARKAVLAALTEKGPAQGRQDPPPRGRPLPALRHGCGTVPFDAVVLLDARDGRRGARGGAVGRGVARPRFLGRHLRELAGEHHGLVHLPPALVGAPDPGVLLPRRAHDRFRGPR